MALRTVNRRSQQRVRWWEGGPIWTYLRPQLHQINELEDGVNEEDLAHDIER